MRYIIMANGKCQRWGGHCGIPKHLISIDGETLLQRTTRLVHEKDPGSEVIISSANPQCVADGARRHEPAHGAREIDRFCYELIDDNVCFLYGDTYYTEEAMSLICAEQGADLQFFGTESSIVAVKVGNGAVMRSCMDALISQIEAGLLEDAKGWQLYPYYQGMPVEGRRIGSSFKLLEDRTMDFNWPSDYEDFIKAQSES